MSHVFVYVTYVAVKSRYMCYICDIGGGKKKTGGEKRGAHNMAYETLENIYRLRMVARVCLSVCVCVCVYM